MMRILVLGATGMLGHKMLQCLGDGFEVAGTVRTIETPVIADFLKPYKIYQGVEVHDQAKHHAIMADYKPDVIINCIGLIKQITRSEDVGDAVQLNASYPHFLAQLAAQYNSFLISFSTDCVFDGLEGKAYDLNDTPKPLDVYGMTKYLGEAVTAHSLVIRSSIIGPELRGRKSLLEWAISQKGKAVQGFKRALYTGFPTFEMAQIVRHILISKPQLRGLWHVSSPPISKFDLLKLFNQHFDLQLEISENQSFYCDRRLNGDAFAMAVGYHTPSWAELVAKMAQDYRKHLPLYQN